MDFRPDSKTLAINYVITLGVVAAIVIFSVGKTQKYYYSPEYTSHQAYDVPVSCNACHTTKFQAFDNKTCSTGDCHGTFGDRRPANFKALAKNEKGEPEPNFGAMLAFHSQLGSKFQCSECHPAHRKPQAGKFNATTMHVELEKLQAAGGAAKPETRKVRHSEIFHENAKSFIGNIMSCHSCHIAPADPVHSVPDVESCSKCHNSVGQWTKAVANAAVAPEMAASAVTTASATATPEAGDSDAEPPLSAADPAAILPAPASVVPTASSALPTPAGSAIPTTSSAVPTPAASAVPTASSALPPPAASPVPTVSSAAPTSTPPRRPPSHPHPQLGVPGKRFLLLVKSCRINDFNTAELMVNYAAHPTVNN